MGTSAQACNYHPEGRIKILKEVKSKYLIAMHYYPIELSKNLIGWNTHLFNVILKKIGHLFYTLLSENYPGAHFSPACVTFLLRVAQYSNIIKIYHSFLPVHFLVHNYCIIWGFHTHHRVCSICSDTNSIYVYTNRLPLPCFEVRREFISALFVF